MPEETFETPQPIEPTVEPKSTDWTKIILAAVLGIGLLTGAAYASYWYGIESSKSQAQTSKPQLKTEKSTPAPIPTPHPPTLWPLPPSLQDIVWAENEDGSKTVYNNVRRYKITIPDSWELPDENLQTRRIYFRKKAGSGWWIINIDCFDRETHDYKLSQYQEANVTFDTAVFAGQDALKHDHFDKHEIIFSKDENYFFVGIDPRSAVDDSEVKQIISSFELLDDSFKILN